MSNFSGDRTTAAGGEFFCRFRFFIIFLVLVASLGLGQLVGRRVRQEAGREFGALLGGDLGQALHTADTRSTGMAVGKGWDGDDG